LGQGGYGTVFLAKKKLPGGPEQLCAIKSVKKKRFARLTSICQAKTEREAMILASGHPFIVTLHSCFQNKVHLFFVMDYVSEEDIRDQLEEAVTFSETRTL
jgi:classical protein kinase C